MKTIWKYTVDVNDRFRLDMPVGAQMLAVQIQGAGPQLWALVDPEAPKEARYFAVHGTGHEIPDDGRKYVGTFHLMLGQLVFHLFECISMPARVP